VNYFKLEGGDPAKNDLFDGIDLTWKRIQGSEKISAALDEAVRQFRTDNPAASLPALIKAYGLMEAFPKNAWVEDKKIETLRAIQDCAGLWLEAIAPQESGIPGSQIKITTSAINRSDFPLTLQSVAIDSNKVDANAPLQNNQPLSKEIELQIPANAPPSQPYWLDGGTDRKVAEVSDQQLIGDPESPPAFTAKFIFLAEGTKLEFTVPVLYRHVDPVRGELYQRFVIVPEVAVNLK